jgi:hypothetical protein
MPPPETRKSRFWQLVSRVAIISAGLALGAAAAVWHHETFGHAEERAMEPR